jgi:hypothetical protein
MFRKSIIDDKVIFLNEDLFSSALRLQHRPALSVSCT